MTASDSPKRPGPVDRVSRTRRIVAALRNRSRQRGGRHTDSSSDISMLGGAEPTSNNTNTNGAISIEVKDEKDLQKADELMNGATVVIVKIGAEWCKHCRDYKKKWEQIKSAPNRNAHMASIPVDLQAKSQVLKNVPVEGVPTVLKVQNGIARAVDLDQANDVEHMTQEVSRSSNVQAEKPAMGNTLEKAAAASTSVLPLLETPNQSEPEAGEPKGQEPTKEMEKAVEKLDEKQSPKDLAETNGSRVDQPAVNLAAQASVETPVDEKVADDFIENAEQMNELMEEEAKEQAEGATPIEAAKKRGRQRGGGKLLPFLRSLGVPAFKHKHTRKKHRKISKRKTIRSKA